MWLDQLGGCNGTGEQVVLRSCGGGGAGEKSDLRDT